MTLKALPKGVNEWYWRGIWLLVLIVDLSITFDSRRDYLIFLFSCPKHLRGTSCCCFFFFLADSKWRPWDLDCSLNLQEYFAGPAWKKRAREWLEGGERFGFPKFLPQNNWDEVAPSLTHKDTNAQPSVPSIRCKQSKGLPFNLHVLSVAIDGHSIQRGIRGQLIFPRMTTSPPRDKKKIPNIRKSSRRWAMRVFQRRSSPGISRSVTDNALTWFQKGYPHPLIIPKGMRRHGYGITRTHCWRRVSRRRMSRADFSQLGQWRMGVRMHIIISNVLAGTSGRS